MLLSQKLRSRHNQAHGRPSNSLGKRSVGTVTVDDDRDVAAGSDDPQARSSRSWQSLAGLCLTSPASPTTMYSISFYPWKMESYGYYSNPYAAAEWVPDTASMRCQICLSAFTFLRRRHHCRICGHLVCNECSLQRTYFPVASNGRGQHHMIRDGEPQRTCKGCANTLKNMAAQDDSRVKRFTVEPASRKAQGNVHVDRPRYWRGRANSRLELERHLESVNNQQQLQCEIRGSNFFPLRLSVGRAEELDDILYARSVSRSKSTSKQFVICSRWLEQWLQYVHGDPITMAARVSQVAVRQTRARESGGLSFSQQRPPSKAPRRPGPVSNYSLLDFVSGSLVPKKGLVRSVAGTAGDYHVVSEEVWLAFVRLYGGGPSIQIDLANGKREDDISNNSRVSTVDLAMVSSAGSTSSTPNYWTIIELNDTAVPMAATSIDDTRRSGSVSRRQSELCESVSAPTGFVHRQDRQHAATDLRSTSGVRSSWAPCGTSEGDKQRWRSGRRWQNQSLQCTSSSGDRAIFQVVEGAILYNPEDNGNSTKEASDNQTHQQDNNDRRPSSADSACPHSTIAAVNAFASAASEARQRSAMSLSRHPSARLSRGQLENH